ncbi:Lrp/AsnC family transcriptional regulator [Haloarcula onubensis]|uniref:Lrp/AsnC family transcriptional regulator n=1 Tax=Haloarcula onubensis TaxID=2950539 RepID=A0ABU2FQ00_9EURY|nr:Lrp/AsnC family transcriptional regulator [Halomicroarcula sp. S3CR25-11]MDS0282819.1 Lrp/AsnC family transcriptional regulator [Halomicroarcula sp. S3CR25-11]
MESNQTDRLDRAILYRLQENARTPVTDIADAVNVSDNTVRNRIQSLEERGVITGYRATVDYDEAGVQHYYLFVCSARVSERDELAEQVRERPCVTEVLTVMTGTYNVYVIAAAAQKDDITDLAEHIDRSGLQIEREHLIRRHTRQPFGRFQPDADS